MIKTINYKDKVYPALQAEGFAAQWIFPFAEKYCTGIGFDVGCNRKEWALPDSIPVDPLIDDKHCAYDLPKLMEVDGFSYDIPKVDYVFSSHCLEHLKDWVAALDYWATRIKKGGILFLYLPNMDYQHYWRPCSNRKHLHYLNPAIMKAYFDDRTEMYGNVFITEGYDLNGSFTVIAEKI